MTKITTDYILNIPTDLKPIPFDPAIDAADKPFDENDDAMPWNFDDWLPLPIDDCCSWLDCNPKTLTIKAFYPQQFADDCLLGDEYKDIIKLGLQGEEVMYYDGKAWTDATDAIEFLTRMAAGTKASTKVVKEVQAALRSSMKKNPSKYVFAPDPWLVCFHNGCLDLKAYYEEWKKNPTANVEQFLLEPSSANRSVIYVPWDLHDLNSPDTCPEAVEYVAKFINKISSGDPDKATQLYQTAASILFGSNNRQPTLTWLVSGGSSGKSSYGSLISDTFGGVEKYRNCLNGAVTDVSIEGLSGRFSTNTLKNANVNIVKDASSEAFTKQSVSVLKSILSGESIFTEEKGKQGYSITPKCKIIVNSNSLPRMSQRDSLGYALERRVRIVVFKEQFRRDSENYDPDIVDNLKKRPVIEAFISIIVPFLCSYIHNNFSIIDTEESKTAFSDMKEECNSVEAFFGEYPEIDNPNAFVNPEKFEIFCYKSHSRDLSGMNPNFYEEEAVAWCYQVYQRWCKQAGRQASSEIMFTKSVSERFVNDIERETNANRFYVDINDPIRRLRKRGWRMKNEIHLEDM